MRRKPSITTSAHLFRWRWLSFRSLFPNPGDIQVNYSSRCNTTMQKAMSRAYFSAEIISATCIQHAGPCGGARGSRIILAVQDVSGMYQLEARPHPSVSNERTEATLELASDVALLATGVRIPHCRAEGRRGRPRTRWRASVGAGHPESGGCVCGGGRGVRCL
ncbi:hypothetical protein B0H12DRAFT_690827 [Mycena haematopus]|nr:hypothetical protein B0H12DRAFT_690827 [Mycena haematopus]